MSNDWTSGYVADVGYTYGYYGELNPLRARLAFLSAGLVPPELNTACELGFGQGVSINVHAAASSVQWHGTDFNPAQAGYAQALASVAGSGAQLHDESFAEFAARELPAFDFIGLHGIWSWVSDENRRVLVDFIRRKLKVGGVLYISYNSLPGWSKYAPLRQLMAQHASRMGAQGEGVIQRVKGSVDFIEKLLELKPLYARANPGTADKLAHIKSSSPEYLAHEFFNKDWVPMYFTEMNDWLSDAKLSYACSAHYLDHIPALNISAEQQQFLAGISDPVLRESTRDFMLNQQFRRDYWVKGARRLPAAEQAARLRAVRVVLARTGAEVSTKIQVPLGEGTLAAAVYGPIAGFLGDLKPHTIGEIEAAVKLPLHEVVQAALVLAGTGQLLPAQDDEAIAAAKPRTDALNRHLLARAASGPESKTLASPVSGDGVPLTWVELLMLGARAAGMTEPAQWVDHTWTAMQKLSQKLIKEGKLLETDAENLAELKEQAERLVTVRLPLLQALGVLD